MEKKTLIIKDLIYKKFGYQFKNNDLINSAIIHPSAKTYRKNTKFTYEKLELLGDTVLAVAITSILIEYFPNETEGDLSKRRSQLVSKKIISDIAEKKKINDLIEMSIGEEKNNGKKNKNNLENAMEAIIGAIYIDAQTIEPITKIIKKLWTPYIKSSKIPPKDTKSELQEIAQKNHKIPKYEIVAINGLAHNPVFTIKVTVENLVTTGIAKNKKEAEMLAAQEMIKKINSTKETITNAQTTQTKL